MKLIYRFDFSGGLLFVFSWRWQFWHWCFIVGVVISLRFA